MTRIKVLVVVGLLVVSGAAPVAAQQVKSLPPGTYQLRMRDSTAANPWGTSFVSLLEGGMVVWQREGAPDMTMLWSTAGDTLIIEDADGCPFDPVGSYAVGLHPAGGYQLTPIQDSCGDRRMSVLMTWLKPVGR